MENTNPPIFTCSICKAKFPSTKKDDAPLAEPEKIAKLKTAVDAATERYLKAKDPVEQNRTEAQMIAAWYTYSQAALRNNVWKVPDELTSHKDQGGWYLACQTCAPKKKHDANPNSNSG
jgi:hypothetical protein